MKNRIEELEKLIIYHKDLYYRGIPEISDQAYDKLESELKKLSPNNPVLDLVGSTVTNLEKVAHDRKMLSLDKTYEAKDLMAWAGDREVISTFKIDGTSCSLIYENKKLIMAKTRGDGVFGENILPKILWIDSIPKMLDTSEKIEVRGELFCTEENFLNLSLAMEVLKLERPTSQRNIVSGLMGRKENLNLCHFISFKAFDLIFDKTKLKDEVEKYQWFKKENFDLPEFSHHRDQKTLTDSINEARDFMAEGDYLIDGLVFTYNNLKLHDEMGETAHHPRYKMAFKFAGETKTSKIKEIIWGVSRNGILTPVAIIEPTELSGATITNVTLHNYGVVKANNLKVGDEIELVRSGEVIPKFLKVIKESSNKFSIPKVCPSCKTDLEIKEIRLICPNNKCPDKIKEDILNFIQKIGIEDLSIKRLEEMINKGLVENIPSLYKMTKEELLTLDKTKETMANKILHNIEKTKKTDIVTFLSALGITGGAFNKCEKVVSNGFNTIDKIKKLTIEDLVSIEGFAEKSSTDFYQSLKSKYKVIDQLLALGFKFEKKKMASDKLSGIKICITGELSVGRKEMEKIIKDNGGIVVSSVSTQTNYLLTNEGDSGSSKSKKAKELEIPIINESDFQKMLK